MNLQSNNCASTQTSTLPEPVETEFFDPKQKPVHIGFYKTQGTRPEPFFQYWTGEYWGKVQLDTKLDYYSKMKSKFQKNPWKGLKDAFNG